MESEKRGRDQADSLRLRAPKKGTLNKDVSHRFFTRNTDKKYFVLQRNGEFYAAIRHNRRFRWDNLAALFLRL
jgi:hypothetical protein